MDSNESELLRKRADQAADGFRTLCAGLAGAMILFSVNLVDEETNKATPTYIFGGQIAALFALYVLGVSWTLQKSKALAKLGSQKSTPLVLTNQVYDVVAFAAFLFSIAWLVIGAFQPTYAGPLACLVCSSFFFIIAGLDWRLGSNDDGPIIAAKFEPSTANPGTKAAVSDWDARQRLFWIDATPEIFKWVSWTAGLAALLYIAQKSGDAIAWGMSIGLSVAIVMYLEAVVIKYLPPLFPRIPNAWSRRLITAIVGSIATLGTYLLALHLAQLLAAK